jgi:hypothetical protein
MPWRFSTRRIFFLTRKRPRGGRPCHRLTRTALVVLDSLQDTINFDHLGDVDRAVIGQALRAAADGPFFPEMEFHTLFGLARSEVRTVADTWPNVDSSDADVALAVNNSLTNLIGYPHGQDFEWSQWISVKPPELEELRRRVTGQPSQSGTE